MAYQEDKHGKFRRQTSKQAIALALQGRWQESVILNKSIIDNFPEDVEAHNRLGKAYMELGDYVQAKEAYNRAMQLDQYNTIAKKNLQRLVLLEGKPAVVAETNSKKADPHLFIEEIGKAGVVNLSQMAPSETLVKMMAGDKLALKPQDSSLIVESLQGEYLGLVPSKIGQRLIKLMEGGNRYTAAVVNSSENSISVIIREAYQDPSQIGQVSFPGKRLEDVQPFITDKVFRPEYEEEEELAEPVTGEEETEAAEEIAEEASEEDKEWEQEA
jgi:tetratricopeptide (TPR) repeat protein